MEEGRTKTSGRYVNKSLGRALAVLDVFQSSADRLTATQIARHLGLRYVGTLYPILATLENGGYLVRDNHKRYALGLKFLERANLVLQRLDLRDAAQETLREIAQRHSVNTHLAVLYEHTVMYLQREEGYPSVIIKEVVGQRVPAYCTALGKVLLAALDEQVLNDYLSSAVLTPLTPYTITDAARLTEELKRVREQGYAVDNEEFHEGSLCVAAPVRDYQGKVIAAVSLSVPKPLAAGGGLAQLIETIQEAGTTISSRLGYSVPECDCTADRCVDDKH